MGKKGGEDWKKIEGKEVEKIFENQRFRAKNWNTQQIKQTIEAMEPGFVYDISAQSFIEKYGKEPVKKLTLRGQKKKIRQVLRRMMDYYSIKVSLEGNIIHVLKE